MEGNDSEYKTEINEWKLKYTKYKESVAATFIGISNAFVQIGIGEVFPEAIAEEIILLGARIEKLEGELATLKNKE